MCDVIADAARWLAVAGLAIDIIGFMIIGFEWRTSMYDGLDRLEIEQDLLALRTGRPARRRNHLAPQAHKLVQTANIEELALDERKFDAFMKNVLTLDAVGRLNRRMWVYRVGFALVILGFTLQIGGAWPCL